VGKLLWLECKIGIHGKTFVVAACAYIDIANQQGHVTPNC